MHGRDRGTHLLLHPKDEDKGTAVAVDATLSRAVLLCQLGVLFLVRIRACACVCDLCVLAVK